MKKVLFIAFCTLSLTGITPWGHAQPLDEAFEQFSFQFQALKPPPGSSINSDYKLEQSALASYYTARVLTLIGKQNQELLSKYDEILKKYDQLLRQNEKIIYLLSIPEKPGRPGSGVVP